MPKEKRDGYGRRARVRNQESRVKKRQKTNKTQMIIKLKITDKKIFQMRILSYSQKLKEKIN